MHKSIRFIKAHAAITFFVFTFTISWGAFVLDVPILYVFGPSVAGVLLMLLTYDRLEQRVFWRRVFGFKRISTSWYLFIILLFPTIIAASLGFNALLGGVLPEMPYLTQIAAQPILLIPVMVEVLVRGPLSEELGWRGYTLDVGLTQWGGLRSSLIIAIIWWVWHLPLFAWASYGSVHYQWGWFTPEFWGFMFAIIPLGILLAWVSLRNHRSILAGILLHFCFNLTFGLTSAFNGRLMLISGILLWLTVTLLLWLRPSQALLQGPNSYQANPMKKERLIDGETL